jgi:hypothetical protein
MEFNKLYRTSVSADYAIEHIDPDIRMGDSTVMLSAAKHLSAQRDRPFAAAQGDIVRHRRLVRIAADVSAPTDNPIHLFMCIIGPRWMFLISGLFFETALSC